MTATEIDATAERVRLMRELTEQIGVVLGGSAPMTRADEHRLDQLHDARLLCWGEVYQPGQARDFYDAGATPQFIRDPGAAPEGSPDDAAHRALQPRLEKAFTDHANTLRTAGRSEDVWDLSNAAVDRADRAPRTHHRATPTPSWTTATDPHSTAVRSRRSLAPEWTPVWTPGVHGGAAARCAAPAWCSRVRGTDRRECRGHPDR